MKKFTLLTSAFTFTFTLLTSFGVAQPYFYPPAAAFATGTAPSQVIVGDFNNDNKKDVAVANTSTNNVSVLLGAGNATFSAAVNFNVGTSPFGLVAGFFNADANLDLAVCNAGTNNVSILLGNGTGGFGAATNFAAGTGPRGITCGDFNGDNKIDLATANYNGANVSVLLGDGLGGFGAPANFTAGTGCRSIVCANLNADAFPDLAVANETSNNVSILLGTGTGIFGAATNFNVGTMPRSICFSDFNGDAKSDLATANGGTNNVSVLIGTGLGTFGAATNFATGPTAYSVYPADFNTDGKMDLAVANLGAGSYTGVSVLMGTGTGSFGFAKKYQSTIWTVPANASSVACADFNTDGKPDIVVANNLYNSVSILRTFIPAAGACTSPMRIVILGASTSFGFGAAPIDSGYAYLFRDMVIDTINGYSEVINLAHAGYTTYAMQPTGYTTPVPYPVDTLRNITKALYYNPDGVIFNFTTNDVNALIALDTTIANFKRATNILDQLGIRYWITTTQPRNFTGDPPATIAQKKQMLLDLRDTIILKYPTNYIESFVGFAQGNGDLLSQYDCGDHAHFNNAGHRKLYNNFRGRNIPNILCSALTGTPKIEEKESVGVYPDPSTGIFNVNSSAEINSIEIYNLMGEKIIIQPINRSTSQLIDLSAKAKGIYFVKVISDNKISVKKIILE